MKQRPLSLLFLVLTILCYSCYELTVFNGVPIRQYAVSVIDFSSEWSPSPGTYSASRALGTENVYPNYGDIVGAWASESPDDQREFLVLGFTTPQTVKTIEIYETYNPGAVDSVFLRVSGTSNWKKVYSRPVVTDLPAESRIFTILLQETPFFTDAIRIAVNSPSVEGWNEIDAVAITGQRKE